MQGFRVRSGVISGRDHRIYYQNCQDALAVREITIAGQEYIIGAVSDGNGEALHSEVGANLLTQFVVNEVPLLLAGEVPIDEIPSALYPRAVGYLRSVASSMYFTNPKELVAFVKEHLLCTLLGFVISAQQGVIFSAGDGVVVVNEEVNLIDQGDEPTYLGYHLVDRRFLQETASSLPQAFDVWALVTADLQRLAIATDGLTREPDLLDKIWGFTHPRGLQRTMNVWSKKEKRFWDDAAMIVLERE